MPAYQFIIHKNKGETEELGAMEMPSDSEALAFAIGVVRDMKSDHPHAGWTMDIRQDDRDAGTVIFDDVQK